MFLSLPEKRPTDNQKKRRWFSYKSSYNAESSGRSVATAPVVVEIRIFGIHA